MNFLVLLFYLGMAVIAAQQVNERETVELTTTLGKVRGSFMKSRLGKTIYSFRGIKYAEPPTGEQRFKQAIPALPWMDVFDATEEGPACPQQNGNFTSEDCLRLNVYSTKLPSKNPSDAGKVKRLVIVFFHPGNFFKGSGQSSELGPNYLMDQDIVLVVANYRLASLGFLSTGDSLAPGNLGLKDQVESLRWVQKNIAAFGGDPNCVTIAGYSAGGRSVEVHLLSPMTKGLFHRAIVMSGAVPFQTLLPHDQKDVAIKQAEFLGCPTDTTSIILDCLNTKTADEIANTLPQFYEWHEYPDLIWSPVVEPEGTGVERYLTAQPVDLIREGKFHDVPFMAGIDKDEFGPAVIEMVEAARSGDTSYFDDLNQNWDKLAPILFLYERNTSRSNKISEALRQFYLKGKPITLDNYEGLSHLFADGHVGFSVHRLVNLIAPKSNLPVYYYKFTYQGRYSHATWSDTKKPFGVVHTDELLYLFYDSSFPYFEESAPEIPTVERMTSIWANFAKTGSPIPCDDDNFTNVTWTPFTVENQKYLDIGDELVMETNLYGDRMNEWDRLFPLQPLEEVNEQ